MVDYVIGYPKAIPLHNMRADTIAQELSQERDPKAGSYRSKGVFHERGAPGGMLVSVGTALSNLGLSPENEWPSRKIQWDFEANA